MVEGKGNPWMISGFLLVVFLLAWHFFTLRTAFDPRGLTEDQLQTMEFNGDIVRTAEGGYAWNPEKEKVKGVPGPLAVLEKARIELGEAFVKKGTNDHGIAYLVMYTVSRFAAGFLAASVVAIMLGPRHHGVWSQFLAQGLSERRRDPPVVLVQTSVQSHSAGCGADNREWPPYFIRERACGGGAGRDAAGRAWRRLPELDRMEQLGYFGRHLRHPGRRCRGGHSGFRVQ